MNIDIKGNIKQFVEESKKEHHRYLSFDYCYNYFQGNKGKKLKENKELSCLHLGFYLASWGMYRGSSFLLQNNYSIYLDLIDYLSELDDDCWNIDLDFYTDENIERILEIYKGIREKILKEEKHKDSTLITKIMLGVFGNIPAFDQFFLKGMKSINGKGFTTVNKTNLKKIGDYYKENKEVFDKIKIECKSFENNNNNKIRIYPKAKLLDMVFFIEGK